MPQDTTLAASFVKHFEADVHTAYQQAGSKLRPTVRSKSDVKGSTCVFQKVGKGVAGTKTRHGDVPVMNITHAPVECELTDYYAGDWVDHLDELKANIDERRVVAMAGAYALGRKTDELIINAISGATNVIGDGTSKLSKGLILDAFAKLNTTEIPDDGQRFAVIGAQQWNALLELPEFSDSAYVGDQHPLLSGTESRKWLGIIWVMHTGLPLNAGVRSCFMYHKTAIGHASASDIKTDISWHGDKAAYFINNMMSQGACLVDDAGIIKISVKE